MIHQWGRTCDQTQRTGLLWSVVSLRCIENSTGAITDIEDYSTTCATYPPTIRFLQQTNDGLFINFQRRMKMRFPNSIATWCLILFFLFYGLSALGLAIPAIILGLLALGVAIFTLLGR